MLSSAHADLKKKLQIHLIVFNDVYNLCRCKVAGDVTSFTL